MIPPLTRREWLSGAAAGLVASLWPLSPHARGDVPPAQNGCTLSIGTYSMKGLPLEKAIETIAALGYDGLEIATQPGFDGEPGQLSAGRRKEVRRLIEDKGLRLTALMENLPPAADAARHRADLDRLRRVLELAHDVAPSRLPLVQTVLGNGTWDEKKALFRDRLADWVAVAKAAGIVLAIKPHRGGALSRPSEAIWLIDQVKEPAWLRMVYDYSHYAFRDMPLEETVRTALPYTAHIAVKDAVQKEGRVVFLLPGESGTFDYARMLRLFFDGGYRGDVCCEVSSMISSKPGYDPVAAARTCYRNMARAFESAGVRRR